ncbi:MAG: permease prefix domain 2-containing transporter, partial [Bacteroidota bacterium]
MSKSRHPYQPPPKWLDKLLERVCDPHLLEEVIGDLHERYYLRVQKEGVNKARRGYWREILAYVRPRLVPEDTLISVDPSNISVSLSPMTV